MSYGVMASKPAQVLVETESLTGRGEASPQHGLDHFNNLYGAAWVSGRITLTQKHLTFVPHTSTLSEKPTERMLEMDVSQIDEVSVAGGLVGGRILTVRCGERSLRMKCRGATALADQIRAAASRGSRAGRGTRRTA
jgi:hypothetical protein